eukprot:1723119-Lingulodinium_polyedra.AAC.1
MHAHAVRVARARRVRIPCMRARARTEESNAHIATTIFATRPASEAKEARHERCAICTWFSEMLSDHRNTGDRDRDPK